MTRFQTALDTPLRKTLAELRPQVGERVRLETRSPRARYAVQLIGFRDGGSVLVSAPRASGGVPPLNEGAPLTARLMAGNWICTFDTRLLKIQSQPYPVWHLEYPAALDVQRVRHHTRVPVNLRVSVDCDEHSTPAAAFPVTALCSDIHVSGACIESSRLLGRVDDKLYITARVSVSGIDHVILAPAIVRNLYESEAGSFPVISHGVEFVDLEEDTRLILAGFVYQQHLIETGYLSASTGV